MAYIVITNIKRIATEKTLTQEEIDVIQDLINKNEDISLIKEYLSAEHDIKEELEKDITSIEILNIDFGEIEKSLVDLADMFEDLFNHSK